ncbi:MAG: hypothetical protein ACRDG2_00655, partial [Actinomycetota bacterium]
MRRIALLIAVLAVTSAACGGDEPAPATGSSPEGESGESISVASTDFGEALIEEDGRSVYMFVPDREENGTPTCYDDCAQAWP